MSENPTVKSAERTVRILETLAASPTRLTLGELQAIMGYPRSSLHALVRTLRELKWVESDETGSSFGIGPHALLSGTAYLDRDPALPYAADALEDLRAEIGYTVHFARRDEVHVLYLATRDSRDGKQRISRVGRRLPAHITALGQALLAELTDDEVADMLPPDLEAHTPHSITSRMELLVQLHLIRERGYAIEREQGSVGVSCIAAPVRYRIPATDAISCSMPSKRAADAQELKRVGLAVKHAAEALANTLRRNGIR